MKPAEKPNLRKVPLRILIDLDNENFKVKVKKLT